MMTHPQARDAAMKAYEYWLSRNLTKEEAFDHAIAEYLIFRGIEVSPKEGTKDDQAT